MDNNYLIKKLQEIADNVIENNSYVTFVYKTLHFVAIPSNDSFPLFLIQSSDVIRYPHIILVEEINVDNVKYSYVCLFEKGSIVEHTMNTHEKIDYSLSQLTRLFNLSNHEVLKEIENEYKYHWQKNSKYSVDSMISCNQEYKKAKLYKYKEKKSKNEQKIVLSTSFPYNKDNYSITEENCFYFTLLDCYGILPPSMCEWNASNLMELFFSLKRNRFSHADYDHYKNLYVKKKVRFFFKVPKWKNFEFGMEITFSNEERCKFKTKLKTNKLESIQFIAVNNNTIENSLFRNGQTPVKYKKVAIIGLGSLGSYIASEIIKLGVKELVLIDDDKLSSENISRHFLGSEFIGKNKAKSMDIVLSALNPSLKIRSLNQRLTKNNIDSYLDDLEYLDLFIIATGDEDTELMINNYLCRRKKYTPAMFVWLEANGLGSHIFMMNHRKQYCFDYILNGNFNFYDNPEKYINRNGCGGTYTVYGIQIIHLTLTLVIDALNAHDNTYNYLYTYKSQIQNDDIGKFTEFYQNSPYGASSLRIDSLKEI